MWRCSAAPVFVLKEVREFSFTFVLTSFMIVFKLVLLLFHPHFFFVAPWVARTEVFGQDVGWAGLSRR